jgi:hypothetical protein
LARPGEPPMSDVPSAGVHHSSGLPVTAAR